jgi:hypothetical protein
MSLCDTVDFQDVMRAVLPDFVHCAIHCWGLEAICMLITACNWHSSKCFRQDLHRAVDFSLHIVDFNLYTTHFNLHAVDFNFHTEYFNLHTA